MQIERKEPKFNIGDEVYASTLSKIRPSTLEDFTPVVGIIVGIGKDLKVVKSSLVEEINYFILEKRAFERFIELIGKDKDFSHQLREDLFRNDSVPILSVSASQVFDNKDDLSTDLAKEIYNKILENIN